MTSRENGSEIDELDEILVLVVVVRHVLAFVGRSRRRLFLMLSHVTIKISLLTKTVVT